MKTFLLCSSLILLMTSATACSNTQDDWTSGNDATDPATDESEIRAKKECSPESYQKAFDRYHEAVEASKRQLQGGPCGAEDAYTISIIEDLQAAVTTCHQFRDVIESSKWAKPVRDVLADDLALPALTGDLGDDLKGLAAALPGKMIYGPGGSLGPTSRILFEANGKAKELRIDWDTEAHEPVQRTKEATWRVHGKVLTVTIGDVETTFDVKKDGFHEGLPIYLFVPAPPMIEGTDTYTSLPSECDA